MARNIGRIKKMFCKDYVWYLGYGSNINKERFLCYIKHDDCRDKTIPKYNLKYIIPNELYFAKNSTRWNNGGVAFITSRPSKQIYTLCRIYLIKKQQFEDLAKQETKTKDLISINFSKVINNGYSIYKKDSWYGKVIYFGKKYGIPIFSITNENDLNDFKKPDISYLSIIKTGIQQVHKICEDDLVKYFLTKKGIEGNYKREEIVYIVRNGN